MLTPVPRRSLSDAVYEQLKTHIVHGQLSAGDALPSERLLCTSLGVNRGALREALKRLEHAGLIQTQHGGGSRVQSFLDTAGLELLPDLLLKDQGVLSTDVARSVLEMRTTLAADAAAKAASRRTAVQAERLEQISRRMVASGEQLAELQHLAMDFWSELVLASHNVAYRLAYNTLERTYRPIFDLLTQALAAELSATARYVELAQAVRDARVDEASSLARTLTELGRAALADVLDALDQSDAPQTGGAER